MLSIQESTEDETLRIQVIIGLVVTVFTCFTQSIGLNLQKKSHIINESHPKERRLSEWHRPMWLTGFVIFLASNIFGSLFSIGFLPIIILAPLGAITLITNAICAKLILDDSFPLQSIFATGMIVVGAVFIAIFGTVLEPSHSLADLILLFQRQPFIIYITLITIILCLVVSATRFLESVLTRIQADHEATCSAVSAIALIKMKLLLGSLYAVISGVLSSLTLLFAKSGVELLLITILDGKNQFDRILSWVIAFAILCSALLQLYYLNRSLQLCDTVLIVPISFCAYNVTSLCNGLMYFNQWNRLAWWQLVLVVVGVIILSLGVFALSQTTHPTASPPRTRSLPDPNKGKGRSIPSRSTERTPLINS
ncbi:hypothetical protein K493DRAFT_220833 [Basidiobolus meristosporus CBS 931.73]|uniref:DUF803-domain-containing protein n=1 Tax=Basidiobolus meristosporus CBS 931.73 TaxID=1314790 RepID=A0A1Y1Y9J3_9FUNG|nr:hypothetical protein K493DRAFT_220833 [Basidiobolus meristosporus CBS 931.73]|eukprot:ORX94689.1 hypothetical protein K493DRAFT_220833 [Basidiobolus meristosporus CBS 931.73]